jgi:hypothetical protein
VGGLTVCSCIAREPAPVTLDRFSGRDPIRRSLPKGCSMSRKGLEKRIRGKKIKIEKNDKILVDVIGVLNRS